QWNSLASIGMGAGLMYFLDPVQGRRRRALVRDKVASSVVQAGDFLDKAARDLEHRAWGIVAEARHLWAREQVDDTTLAARVRPTVGRAVTHPHAIAVTVHQGRVTLRGPILAREVPRLLEMVQAVRGVQAVDNHLDVYQQAANISSLQGEGSPRRRQLP